MRVDSPMLDLFFGVHGSCMHACIMYNFIVLRFAIPRLSMDAMWIFLLNLWHSSVTASPQTRSYRTSTSLVCIDALCAFESMPTLKTNLSTYLLEEALVKVSMDYCLNPHLTSEAEHYVS